MTLNKITKIILKIFAGILVIGGMLSLLKGCSPEWDGHEGGAAVGAAFQALGFVIYGIFLWIVTGCAVVMYKMSTAKNKVVSIFSVFISTIAGLFLPCLELLTNNPFARSNSHFLSLIPGKLIGFLSGAIFILIGINAFTILILTRRGEDG
jgi:hypothetical protein